MTEPITEQNFNQAAKRFLEAKPDSWVMIRPDRPTDKQSDRYSTDDERRRGDMAMKAWFEYFAAKGWIRRFNTWRSILKSGHSLMVPCERPEIFDLTYIPSAVLPANFWDKWALERTRSGGPLTEQELARRKRICQNMLGDLAKKIENKLGKSSGRIGDSRTPIKSIPWEERAKHYRDSPVGLSGRALKTDAAQPWPEESEL